MEPSYETDPVVAAREKNLDIVYPAPDELFLDIDDHGGLMQFYSALPIVGKSCGLVGLTMRPSPSGKDGRFHIVVKLGRNVKDSYERIMLQALMGSDRLHETLSWLRARRSEPNPTLFFEKKPELLAAAKEAA